MPFKRVVWLIVNGVLLLVREKSAQDIYCNKETKPWKHAMADCIFNSGHVVPYVTGLGNQISDLQLKPVLTIWTADYIKQNEVEGIRLNDPDLTNYKCGYLNVNVMNRNISVVNNTFGDCFKERYGVCLTCNDGCPYSVVEGTWASIKQSCQSMWDGSEYIGDVHGLLNGVATVWIDKIRHYTYAQLSEYSPFVSSDNLVLCGAYNTGTTEAGLQYTSCKSNVTSLCRFDKTEGIPSQFTKACFLTDGSSSPMKKTTQAHSTQGGHTSVNISELKSPTLLSLSPQSNKQTSITKTTFLPKEKSVLPVDTTSQPLKRISPFVSQSEGSGLTIGIAVSAAIVVTTVTVLSAVFIIRRRNKHKEETPQEDTEQYCDLSVDNNPSLYAVLNYTPEHGSENDVTYMNTTSN